MEELTHGLIPGGTVRDALLRTKELFGTDQIYVIRCIDSMYSREDLGQVLSKHGVPHHVIQGNICIDRVGLEKAVTVELFTGFDEVWILPDGRLRADLGPLTSATSCSIRFSEGLPADLVDAIGTLECSLVLGDGCGLNFATPDERLAELVKQAVA